MTESVTTVPCPATTVSGSRIRLALASCLLLAVALFAMSLAPASSHLPSVLHAESAGAAVPISPTQACTELAKAAKDTGVPVVVVAAGIITGACYGWNYGKSAWWNNNFDRIYNRCWPNCSSWDFVRMVLG